MGFTIPPVLISTIILSVGALIVLLFTSALTRNTLALAAVGAATLVVSVIPALRGDGATQAATLVVALAGIVAMLLLYSVEIEEPSQKPEIAALVLLGAAGGIVFATANDLLTAVIGLETLSLTGATLAALSRGTRPLEAAFTTSCWRRSRRRSCCSESGWSSSRPGRSTGRRWQPPIRPTAGCCWPASCSLGSGSRMSWRWCHCISVRWTSTRPARRH